MQRDVIFFDLDGTLVDSMPMIIESIVTGLVAEHGLDEAEVRASVTGMLSLPAREMFAAVLRLGGIELDQLSPEEGAATVQRYLASAEEIQAEPYPEVVDVLASLRTAGYTLFVTTNSPAYGLGSRLESVGLLPFFRGVFGTGGGVFKGPAHISMAAAELDCGLEDIATRSVLVGDSVSDMLIAVEAGMVGIGRLTGDNAAELRRAGAAHLLEDLRGLLPLLDEL